MKSLETMFLELWGQQTFFDMGTSRGDITERHVKINGLSRLTRVCLHSDPCVSKLANYFDWVTYQYTVRNNLQDTFTFKPERIDSSAEGKNEPVINQPP